MFTSMLTDGSMVQFKKPKSITITIGDRKDNVFKSFVVYDTSVEEVEEKIKKSLEKDSAKKR